jgi:phospholipase/carboxylesterase
VAPPSPEVSSSRTRERYAGVAVLYGTLPFDAGLATAPGQLDGSRVLVVHGDQDLVIPRDLLDRTWSYLEGDAGSDTTALRDPGGHGLSDTALGALQRWLTGVPELALPAS